MALENPRTMLSWTNAIAQALEARGVKSRRLFDVADVPYPSTVDPTYHIESQKVSTLLELSVKETNDPAFGLMSDMHCSPVVHCMSSACGWFDSSN